MGLLEQTAQYVDQLLQNVDHHIPSGHSAADTKKRKRTSSLMYGNDHHFSEQLAMPGTPTQVSSVGAKRIHASRQCVTFVSNSDNHAGTAAFASRGTPAPPAAGRQMASLSLQYL